VKLSFNKWLKSQRSADTAVGDLARDVAYDAGFPKRGSLQTYVKHLEHKYACDGARYALTAAWSQWQESIRQ